MKPVRVDFAIEGDGDGRTVRGTAVRYGVEATKWGERLLFMAGAFGDVGRASLLLNLHHDRARPVAAAPDGGLRLTDSAEALLFEADVARCRDGDDCLSLIRAGVLKGASMEVAILESTVDADVRRITRAAIDGLAIVARPAFSSSTVEAEADAPRSSQEAAGGAICELVPQHGRRGLFQ